MNLKCTFPATSQVHSILSVAGAQSLFVAERGRLVGCVTWPEVMTVIICHERSRDAILRFCIHLWRFVSSSHTLQTRPCPSMDSLTLCTVWDVEWLLKNAKSLSLPPLLFLPLFSPPDEENNGGVGQRSLSSSTWEISTSFDLFFLNYRESISV